MAEYAGTWSYVSPTVGQAALKLPGARVMGMPGFGQGPVYGFDAGPGMGMVYYSFGPDVGTAKVESASTGVTPTETSYALYGHIIPLSVFGRGRIGGDIISGPFVENGLATFCISFGVPADPYGTRILQEIAFDSEVVWENGAFNIEAFTFRFYPGRLDQAADPIEIAHWGADAIAYRPQILLWFENLPISNTKFQKIPYVAAVFEDGIGPDVNLGECFERLAYSPWVGYTPDQFESVGVTDGLVNGGLIIAQDAEFLSTVQQFARFYRNWSILQTDKLRIVDRGANVTPDIILDESTLTQQIVFSKAQPTSVPRILELSTIDPEADYTIVPSRAVRTLEPVNVSASVSTETVYLPMIMDSSMRMALVTYTKYLEEVARKTLTLTAMAFGFEIEPGDFLAVAGLGTDFADNTFKIVETSHGANYTVEVTAEAFFNCGPPQDPFWIYVVLLMGYESGITDESLKLHGTTGDPSYLDTAHAKFGSQSLATMPGTDVIYPESADWLLSAANSDQFTVECWARLTTTITDVEVMVGKAGTGVSWIFAVNVSELRFSFKPVYSGPYTDVVSSGAGIVGGIWYHFAVDKDSSGKIRLYRNGVMVGSATPANSAFDASAFTKLLYIGEITAFGSNDFVGNIDELRITKGIARYQSDGGFPLPTAPWPRGGPL